MFDVGRENGTVLGGERSTQMQAHRARGASPCGKPLGRCRSSQRNSGGCDPKKAHTLLSKKKNVALGLNDLLFCKNVEVSKEKCEKWRAELWRLFAFLAGLGPGYTEGCGLRAGFASMGGRCGGVGAWVNDVIDVTDVIFFLVSGNATVVFLGGCHRDVDD